MKHENDDISDLLPLREPTFYILLSLFEGRKHGYAILKDVAEISGGKVNLGTGTLYEALARLLDQALIERVDAVQETNSRPGRPRKAYRLTPRGGQVVRAEAARLDSLLAAARGRLGVGL